MINFLFLVIHNSVLPGMRLMFEFIVGQSLIASVSSGIRTTDELDEVDLTSEQITGLSRNIVLVRLRAAVATSGRS